MTLTPHTSHRTVFVLTALMILMAAVWLSACGRKAAPVPPRYLPPPVVRDLAGRMTDNQMTLTWTLPAGDDGTGPAESVVVYRHRSVAGDAICPGCPPIYTPLATVPVDGGKGSEKRFSMVYRTQLERGYRYLFKVVARGRDGVPGSDSNLVQIDF
ncbi:MAG: hypothetical protein JEZ11_09525 [Desulfobacterales bacterium]|nr:hypothetical protein [Desulfobacterales bacterium]